MNTARRGFTLVEILIAVGAVSLIAIGLARVFSATGDTVRAGRRLSNFNEYAAMLERQLRDDVASMTRDGFLVIRNRVVTSGSGPITIRLDPDQDPAHARSRRVDQIMFFTQGRYSTLRDPIHPSRVPSSTAARVYYGHGLRQDDDGASIRIDQHGGATTNQSSFGASGGPNEFAADWILLRHETALVDEVPVNVVPVTGLPGVTAAEQVDSAYQVALQPASPSLFRHIALALPQVPDAQLVRDEGSLVPMFSSGIVDLAVTNLAQIRQIVLDAQPCPNSQIDWNPSLDSSADGPNNPFGFQRDATPASPTGITANMKRWMISALPAGWLDPLSTQPERRMRCELVPPDLFKVAGGGGGPTSTPLWYRSDRMMLAASNIVPHCTEFIVEWSFGVIENDPGDPGYGELKWYGLPRYVDETDPDSVVAEPYVPTDPDEFFMQTVARRNATPFQRQVRPALIHYPAPSPTYPQNIRDLPLYSCFGYVDPTYPDNPAFETDPQQRYPATVPWAWPRLLRITISLVDPSDRLREQTYQFVIEVPQAKSERY